MVKTSKDYEIEMTNNLKESIEKQAEELSKRSKEVKKKGGTISFAGDSFELKKATFEDVDKITIKEDPGTGEKVVESLEGNPDEAVGSFKVPEPPSGFKPSDITSIHSNRSIGKKFFHSHAMHNMGQLFDGMDGFDEEKLKEDAEEAKKSSGVCTNCGSECENVLYGDDGLPFCGPSCLNDEYE